MSFFSSRCPRGFTLVEVVVVVLIVGILAAIAIPSYQDSIKKGRRGDAKAELSRLVQAQEKWRVTHPAYAFDGEVDAVNNVTFTTPDSNYYAFSVTANSDTNFTISAVPVGDADNNAHQASDVCHTLFIDNTGVITSDSGACPTP